MSGAGAIPVDGFAGPGVKRAQPTQESFWSKFAIKVADMFLLRAVLTLTPKGVFHIARITRFQKGTFMNPTSYFWKEIHDLPAGIGF